MKILAIILIVLILISAILIFGVVFRIAASLVPDGGIVTFFISIFVSLAVSAWVWRGIVGFFGGNLGYIVGFLG